MVDFATIEISDTSWDPKKVFNLKEEISSTIDYLDESIPLAATKEILFRVPSSDNYIDQSNELDKRNQRNPPIESRKFKKLEKLIGKINHAAFIIPSSR